MRRFANLNENNIVVRVIVAEDETWIDKNLGGVWVESFTEDSRFKRASEGDTYDAEREAFIKPQPFQSWILNEETYIWEPPVQRPVDDNDYFWDEATTSWIEVTE